MGDRRDSFKAPEHELGVLLVHGIGESRRGDTLMEWGAALARCLHEWLSPAGVQAVVSRASIEPPGDEPEAPPHAEIVLDPVQARFGSPAATKCRWLLAESWWAKAFPPPSYRDLAVWSLGVLPWTIISHFDRRLRRVGFLSRWARSLPKRAYVACRWFVEATRLLLALLLLPFVMVFVLLVLAVGLIPGPIRAAAEWVQRLMSGYVGDSFVLVANDVAAAAIRERVRTDLEWLAARCKRVVILAHSQGAAIAHDLLRRNPTAPCQTLFTFGSGLRKLWEIRQAKEYRAFGLVLFAIVGTWVAVAGVVMGLSGGPPGRLLASLAATLACGGILAAVHVVLQAKLPAQAAVRITGFLLGLIFVVFAYGAPWHLDASEPQQAAMLVVAAGLLLMWASMARWHERTSRAVAPDRQWRIDDELFGRWFRLPNRDTEWIDVFASADIVPNGPLLDDRLPHGLRSYEIPNRGSPIEDHTTYWKNEGFVWRTAYTLLERCGIDGDRPRAAGNPGADPPAGAIARLAAEARRSWRVLCLVWLRRLVLASVLVLLWRWWSEAPSWMLDLVAAARQWIGAIPWVGKSLAGAESGGVGNPAGISALLAMALVVFFGARLLWLRWDTVEAERGMQGERVRWWQWEGLALALAWVGLCEAVARLAGLAGGPVPWSLPILSVIYLGAWAIHARGHLGVIQSLRILVAAGDPQSLLAERQNAQARWLLREAKTGDPRAHMELGFEMERQARADADKRAERTRQAEQHFRAALASNHVGAAWFLGHNLESQGRTDEAEALFRRGFDLGDPGCGYALGHLLRWRKPADARHLFAEAAGRGDEASARASGEMLREAGQRPEAREALNHAAGLGDERALFVLGQMAEEDGDLVEAAARFEAAGDRGDREAWIALGELRRKTGDRDGARAAFEQALRTARCRGDAWIGERAALALADLFEGASEPGLARELVTLAATEFGSVTARERLERPRTP